MNYSANPSDPGHRPIESERRRPPSGPAALSVDMHIHSNYSDAPQSTIEAIEEICERKQIGASIADHNEIRGSILMLERGKVLTLPAIEVGSAERLEFIAYFHNPSELEEFYRTSVEPFKRSRFYTMLNRSFTVLLPEAKEAGALVCLPHPFAPSYKSVNFGKKRKELLFSPELFTKVDLIEVINGHVADHRNFKAFMLSEIFDKNVTAGSDAHRPQDIGTAFLRFDREVDRRGLFALLHYPIKVGMMQRYSFAHFARTTRRVFPKHLQLFFSKKFQRQWMMKYENGEGRLIDRSPVDSYLRS